MDATAVPSKNVVRSATELEDLMWSAHNPEFLSPYDKEIIENAKTYGGFFNAHTHLCRADLLNGSSLQHIGTTPIDASSLPLSVKQSLVGDYHLGEGYIRENLLERGRTVIRRLIAYGTKRVDTNVDATPDLPEGGLLAINVFSELKQEFVGMIDIRIAPTPIFGFKATGDTPNRWEVFKAAAAQSDYLSLLPEKDDFDNPDDRDGKVGFKKHIRMGIDLACELGKEVQFHLDQTNTSAERGTERLLEIIDALDMPVVPGNKADPVVWIIHMISPSAYDERRFKRLLEGLRRYNIGIIVCPSAALSMRQLRSLSAPIHNSIARVLEIMKSKIPLRIGTDNIADVFVPASDGDMLTEIKMGAQATRLYNPSIWAKLACGIEPNNVDISTVGRILHEDRKANWGVNPDWQPAIE